MQADARNVQQDLTQHIILTHTLARARAHTHTHTQVGHLRKQMPAMFGKEKAQKKLLEDLPNQFTQVRYKLKCVLSVSYGWLVGLIGRLGHLPLHTHSHTQVMNEHHLLARLLSLQPFPHSHYPLFSPPPTHNHTRTHARAHTRAHTHTHTHAHTGDARAPPTRWGLPRPAALWGAAVSLRPAGG